ncbi:MAG: right-handed parallel beta-helix repeat-containing protein [Candidatus Bathyarchaeota archaeon]|nr:MAG: right-handed parallel beta-helix repeat-containing protein [Candidatus Bathyarchaeota archaeon]
MLKNKIVIIAALMLVSCASINYAPSPAGQTWIVTSTMDSGMGTLRWCLANATNGDTIAFDSSVFPPTSPANIILTSELQYIIQGNLTIDASGAGVILNGSQTTGDTVGLVVDSENNTIKGLQILHFPGWGMKLTANANNNTIGGDRTIGTAPSGEGNVISANGRSGAGGGITLSSSSNNTILGNNITNNEAGIWLLNSSNNHVSGNNIMKNVAGLLLLNSSHNLLRDNAMTNNTYNFVALGKTLGHYINDVDASNIVNNKPVIYWINRQNQTIPQQAGYVAAINSTSITIKDLDLKNNWGGLVLAYTQNSVITSNNIVDNVGGIYLHESSNNSISENNIENNGIAISLDLSSNNFLSRNNVRNNWIGIHLHLSSDNKFYHNNFINNTEQVSYPSHDYANFWDDGYPSGGNYWSDYTGSDLHSGPYQNETGSDGIGDLPYVIDGNNEDMYPFKYLWPDTTSPTTTDDYDGLWHAADFMITLTATDDKSGVKSTYYKINDDPTKTVGMDGQPLITTESANNTLEYWSVDNSGNEELPHKILTGIKLDKTPPTIGMHSRIPEGFVQPNQAVKVFVNVTDVMSGVERVWLAYFINNNTIGMMFIMAFNSTTGLYFTSFGIPGQQANTLIRYAIMAYDNAGNHITDDNIGQYYVYTVIPEFPTWTATLLILALLSIAITIYKRRQLKIPIH